MPEAVSSGFVSGAMVSVSFKVSVSLSFAFSPSLFRVKRKMTDVIAESITFLSANKHKETLEIPEDN